MKGTTNPARLEQITRLAGEFGVFTKIFADILKVKRDSALVTQNQLMRGGNMLRYKLDDLPSNADDVGAAGGSVRRQEGGRAVPGGCRRSPIPSSSIRTRRSPPARWRA